MKAIVYTRYGTPDELRPAELETPVPTGDQVLVRIRAVSLNGSDWEGLRGEPLYARMGGLRRPRRHVLGSDVAGTVEAVGPGATRVRPGQDVFADILTWMGGFAEYVCVPERALAPMPAGMTYAEAAALPQAGAIAVHGILDRGVGPGDRVLVNGAGGGSGMYAVQLAKLRGAEVTGVDNTVKQDFMRSLGADHVLDHTRDDWTRNGQTYDLVLDLAAYRSASAYARSLAPGGRYLCVGGSTRTLLGVLLLGPFLGRRRDAKVRVLPVRLGAQHVAPLAELCRSGEVTTHIDRTYPLPETPEALRYLGSGQAKGKVVILVA